MGETMKFRKRPVVVEAVQFTEGDKNRVFNWITCNHYPNWDHDGRPTIVIETLEGEHTASLGDWIIKGVKGEFYPCKPDIFALTYEPADTPDHAATLEAQVRRMGAPETVLNPDDRLHSERAIIDAFWKVWRGTQYREGMGNVVIYYLLSELASRQSAPAATTYAAPTDRTDSWEARQDAKKDAEKENP